MHSELAYPSLHDALLGYNGKSLYVDVLGPWVQAYQEHQWLRAFRDREGPIPSVVPQDLWRLYGLNRICDLLALSFQCGQADGSDWAGPPISLGEFEAFAKALGLQVLYPTTFSPFFHEIVLLEPSGNLNQPARVLQTLWPCLMLGDMLISRAGVRVSAGTSVLHPDVAVSSTLYWASRRKYRPYADRSHGWGHNSRWRTCFRRDYRVGDDYWYNVDGKHDLASSAPTVHDEPLLRIDQRIELLTHRCLVTFATPHADLWPYDDTLRVHCSLTA